MVTRIAQNPHQLTIETRPEGVREHFFPDGFIRKDHDTPEQFSFQLP